MPTPSAANEFVFASTADGYSKGRIAVLADGTLALAAYTDANGGAPPNPAIRLITRNIDATSVADVQIKGAADLFAQPSITALADGNVVVGFGRSDSNPSGYMIRGRALQFIDNEENYLFVDDGFYVAALPNGNFVMTIASNDSVYFEIRGPNGNSVVPGQFIGVGVTDSEPEVTALADGGFVIVATGSENSGDPIFSIRNADGTLRAEGSVSASGLPEVNPTVVALANGDWIALFVNTVGADGNGDGVYGVRFTASGQSLGFVAYGPNVSVNETPGGDQNQPAGLGLRDGTFVLSWINGDSSVVARLLAADGTPISAEFVVGAGDAVANVSLAEMADGRFIVTWDETATGLPTQVMARIYDSRETPITRFGTTLGDQWVGTLWSDTLYGSDGDDRIQGAGGDDLIDGENGNDILGGGAGNDIVRGGEGSNTLDGGTGYDKLFGGTGADAYYYDGFDRIVDEGGTDAVFTTASVDLRVLGGGAIENAYVDYGALGSVSLTGTDGANFLIGTLSATANQLTGLLGDDQYFIGLNDTVVEGVLGGTDTISASINIDLASIGHGNGNVENVVILSTTASASGTNEANRLDGRASSAANQLTGLLGDDTFVVGAGDTVIETGGLTGGNDTIESPDIAIDLGTADHGGGNVENARATGTSAFGLTGNGAANMLDGSTSTGANTLIGLGGNDSYFVGAGDTASEAGGSGTDSVTSSVDFTLGTGIETLILIGSASNGTGNGSVNTIVGNGGANILDGGVDAVRDTLRGLTGNDTYVLRNGTDLVQDTGGVDTITSTITRSLGSYVGVENLTMLGAGIGTGTAGVNVLDASLGAGAAQLRGMGGNDTYIIGAGDTVNETLAGSAGVDTVRSLVTHTLALNVENLVLTGVGNLRGTGNAGNNTITGNGFANVLQGLNGADMLNGGGGIDTLIGGNQNDTFIFNSAVNGANRATIADLNEFGNDTIRLENTGAGLFNALANGVLNALAYTENNTGAATTVNQRIIYQITTGKLFYDADGLGGVATAIQFATLDANKAALYSNADFLVI